MPTLLVVPTYNERESLPRLLEAILSRPDLAGCDVLIVDDASPDGTGFVAEQWRYRAPRRVFVLHRTGPRGFASALRDGFAWGLRRPQYATLGQMDADGSHDPRFLPALLALTASTDVVIGSRYVPGGSTPGWSRARRLLSRSASAYAAWWLHWPIRDGTSGFKIWKRSTLEALDWTAVQGSGYVCQIELLYQAWVQRRTLVEVPIVFPDRRAGQSKMTAGMIREALWTVPRLTRRLGMRPAPESLDLSVWPVLKK